MGTITTATKRYTFEASHYLPEYNGKCSNIHGHSYKLEVTFTNTNGLTHTNNPMVLDFNLIDDIVKPFVERYDHSYLNNFFKYPTAEVIANSLYSDISSVLKDGIKLNKYDDGLVLTEVKLWETEKCFVTVSGGN